VVAVLARHQGRIVEERALVKVRHSQRAAHSSQLRTSSLRSISAVISGSFLSATSRSRSIAALAAQADRWAQLAARAMTERAETAHGLRICFRPGPGVEEALCRLVAVEKECCPWADWTVETNARQIVLNVRSSGAGIAALHGMFTNLQPTLASRCD
jgi:hypothetical protein